MAIDLKHCRLAGPISVVIPCYNCDQTIERAIQSIVDQTLSASEVVIIDDGSDRKTTVKLREIAKKHKGWITLIKRPNNLGAASARNLGWEKSQQKYIAFLDADDTWHPEKLSIQFDYMEANPDVGLTGCLYTWLHKEGFEKSVDNFFQILKVSPCMLLFRNYFSTPSVMLRRNLEMRFPEGQRYSEDYCLWQRLAFAGVKIMRIELNLVLLHKAPFGATGLSSHLWKMEKNELGNLWSLYQAKRIGIYTLFLAMSFSLLKFAKRTLYKASNLRRFQ